MWSHRLGLKSKGLCSCHNWVLMDEFEQAPVMWAWHIARYFSYGIFKDYSLKRFNFQIPCQSGSMRCFLWAVRMGSKMCTWAPDKSSLEPESMELPSRSHWHHQALVPAQVGRVNHLDSGKCLCIVVFAATFCSLPEWRAATLLISI